MFWLALMFAVVMASLPQPPAIPGGPSDKIMHILAFLVITCFATLAFPRVRLRVLLLGLVSFGAAIEIVQSIPELGREPSWLDLFADIGAICTVLLIAAAKRGRLSRQAH